MAPVALLEPQPGERICDLCAAPGGKTTQIAGRMQGEGFLLCNEINPKRAKILSRNMERMAVPNALVTNAHPADLAERLPGFFDRVLVDAPCSGEGMFRKEEAAVTDWSQETVEMCARRQGEILHSGANMVRPGGRLVYSTCTFSPEENEQAVEEFLKTHPDFHLQEAECPWFSRVGEGMYRLWPHKLLGEGHFVAQLRKADTAAADITQFLPADSQLAAPDKAMAAAYAAFCKAFGGDLPKANACFGDMLISAPDLPPLKGLKVLRAGLQLGSMKGKIFMPDHALAMGLPTGGGYPNLAVDEKQAAAYQRGETLPAPEGLNGFCLVTLDGLSLGFGKASDGQVKNHYPKGLRRG